MSIEFIHRIDKGRTRHLLKKGDFEAIGTCIGVEGVDPTYRPHVVFTVKSNHSRVFDGLKDVDP